MTTKLFHHKSKDDTIDSTPVKDVELSDEQLKQVSGGFIVNSPQGQLDWQKRQEYQQTHPGVMIPF